MAIDKTKFVRGNNLKATDFVFDDTTKTISVDVSATSSVGAAISSAVANGVTFSTAANIGTATATTEAVSPGNLATALNDTATAGGTAMQKAVVNAVQQAIAADAGAQAAIATAIADDLGATAAETIAGTVTDKFVAPDDLKATLQAGADYPISINQGTAATGARWTVSAIQNRDSSTQSSGAVMGEYVGAGHGGYAGFFYRHGSASGGAGLYANDSAAMGASDTQAQAVYGLSEVDGKTAAQTAYGVFGRAQGTGGVNVGVYGIAANGSTNWAGYFDGSVKVQDGQMHSRNTVASGVGKSVRGDTVSVNYASGSATVDSSQTEGPVYAQIYGGAISGQAAALMAEVNTSAATTGVAYAVKGISITNGGTAVGVYGFAAGGTTSWAGYFDGNVYLAGGLRQVVNVASGPAAITGSIGSFEQYSGLGAEYAFGHAVQAVNVTAASTAFCHDAFLYANDGGSSTVAAGKYMHALGGSIGSGTTNSGTTVGVFGRSQATGGTNIGVYGEASGGTANWAGYFNGNVNVNGSVVAYDNVSVIRAGGSRVSLANTYNTVALVSSEIGGTARFDLEVANGNVQFSVDAAGITKFGSSGRMASTTGAGFTVYGDNGAGDKQVILSAADGFNTYGATINVQGNSFSANGNAGGLLFRKGAGSSGVADFNMPITVERGAKITSATGATYSTYGSSEGGTTAVLLAAGSGSSMQSGVISVQGNSYTGTGNAGGIEFTPGNSTSGIARFDMPVLTTGSMTATSYITSSDERGKEEIETINAAKAAQFKAGLRWVTYRRKSDGGYAAGLIAQEVLALAKSVGAFEFVVHGSEESGYSVDYASVQAICNAA